MALTLHDAQQAEDAVWQRMVASGVLDGLHIRPHGWELFRILTVNLLVYLDDFGPAARNRLPEAACASAGTDDAAAKAVSDLLTTFEMDRAQVVRLLERLEPFERDLVTAARHVEQALQSDGERMEEVRGASRLQKVASTKDPADAHVSGFAIAGVDGLWADLLDQEDVSRQLEAFGSFDSDDWRDFGRACFQLLALRQQSRYLHWLSRWEAYEATPEEVDLDIEDDRLRVLDAETALRREMLDEYSITPSELESVIAGVATDIEDEICAADQPELIDIINDVPPLVLKKNRPPSPLSPRRE